MVASLLHAQGSGKGIGNFGHLDRWKLFGITCKTIRTNFKTSKENIIMRSILFTILFSLCAGLFAQSDVTKFLGIPIDGFKPDMIRSLESKGFVYDKQYDYLEGEFNGAQVNLYVVTNNNKVWRIMVCDKNHVSETSIKLRFNTLIQQFKDNGKYIPLGENNDITDEEDLMYETTVNDKRYEAVFAQVPTAIDTLSVQKQIAEKLENKYGKEKLENPTEEITKEIAFEAYMYLLDECKDRPVWFMINNSYGQFYITMFYDNEKNKSKGEDL